MDPSQKQPDTTLEVPVGTSLVVIARDERSVRSAVAFLNRRGIPTKIVTNMNDAIDIFSKKQANMALLSVNYPHPKIEMLPSLLQQSFKADTILFAEDTDRKTTQRLSNTKARQVLFGPVSGPTVMMRVRQIEKENLGSEASLESEGSSGPNEKSGDDDGSAIKVGGGKGDHGDRINVKSKKRGVDDPDAASALKSLAEDDGARIARGESLERSGETYIQKGRRSAMMSATQSGPADKSRRGELAARAFGRAIDMGLSDAPKGKKAKLFVPPPPWTTPEKEAELEAREEAELIAEVEAAEVAESEVKAEASKAREEKNFERAQKEAVDREGEKRRQEEAKAEKKQKALEREEARARETESAKLEKQQKAKEREETKAREKVEAEAEKQQKAKERDEKNAQAAEAAKRESTSKNEAEVAKAKADEKVAAEKAVAEKTADSESGPSGLRASTKESAPSPKSEATPSNQKTVATNSGATAVGAKARPEPVKLREPASRQEELFLRCLKEAMSTVCGEPFGVKTGLSNVRAAGLVSVKSQKIEGAFVIEVGRSRLNPQDFLQRIEVAFFSILRRSGIELQQGEQFAIELEDYDIVKKAVEASDYMMISSSPDHEVAAAVVPVTRPFPKLEAHSDKMLKVQLGDLPIDVPITFDVFLHLPSNKKYLRYLKVGSKMSGKQSSKLGQYRVSHLFLNEGDRDAYRKHYAAQSIDPGKKGDKAA